MTVSRSTLRWMWRWHRALLTNQLCGSLLLVGEGSQKKKNTALKNACARSHVCVCVAGEAGGGMGCSPAIQMFPIFNSACPTGLSGISELKQTVPPHRPDWLMFSVLLRRSHHRLPQRTQLEPRTWFPAHLSDPLYSLLITVFLEVRDVYEWFNFNR